MKTLSALSRRAAAVMLCASALVAATTRAQTTPQLVADLTPTRLTSTGISNAVTLTPDRTVFVARTDPESPRQLWATGGTVDSTFQLSFLGADPIPGPISGRLMPIGDKAVFFTSDTSTTPPTASLWVTDGSSSGTVALRRGIATGVTRGVSYLNAGARLFIVSEGQRAIIVTDGTAAGTIDLPFPANAVAPVAFNADAVLFRTNLTPALIVAQVAPLGTTTVFPQLITASTLDTSSVEFVSVTGGFILTVNPLFSASAPTASTYFINNAGFATLLRSQISVLSGQAAEIGPFAYSLENSAFEQRIVRTTLSSGVTVVVAAVPAVSLGSLPSVDLDQLDIKPLDARFIFMNRPTTSTASIMISNGSPSGTIPLATLSGPAVQARIATNPVQVGSRFAFEIERRATASGPFTRELWITDGTPAGTAQITLPPGARRTNRSPLVSAASTAFMTHAVREDDGRITSVLSAIDDLNQFVPVRTTTDELHPFSWMRVHASVDGKLLFTSPDSNIGAQPNAANGFTAGAVTTLNVLSLATDSSDIRLIRPIPNGVLMWSDTPQGHTRLYRIENGSPPQLVKEWTGTFTSTVQPSLQAGTRTVFVIDTAAEGAELWSTDGTPAGTVLVADIAPGPADSVPILLGTFRGEAYFRASTSFTPGNTKLYATSGEPGSLREVATLFPNAFFPFAADANGFYFTAQDSSSQFNTNKLYVSDGTPGGTRPIASISPGALYSFAFTANDRYFFNFIAGPSPIFRINDANNGVQNITAPFPDLRFAQMDRLLFTSRSTPITLYSLQGVGPAQSLFQFPSQAFPWAEGFTGFDGKLFLPVEFVAPTRRGILVTDTTLPGTEIWDLGYTASPTYPGYATGLTVAANRLYFEALSPGFGIEPWVTDGRFSTLRQLGDINPGPASSFPSQFTGSAGKTYFSAYSAATGEELYVVDACPADFNADGMHTTDDVFDYIAAWFRSSPRATAAVGSSAVPTLDDLFAFINLWFAGCP